MLSVVITAKEEAGLIQRAIRAFQREDYLGEDYEIIVVAPDKETLAAAEECGSQIRVVRDKGISKAAAMSLIKAYVRGERIIFSDGDVVIRPGAVRELLKVQARAVTGRPVYWQTGSDEQPYRFWQECLVDTAHYLRVKAAERGDFISLSGYLFLINSELFKRLNWPNDLLAEDEYLSYWLWFNGYKIAYAPQAEVLVKYPNNYQDWLRQKVRTLAGNYQVSVEWKRGIARNFNYELRGAVGMWRRYVKNVKEAFWLIWLFAARAHAWVLAWLKFKVFKQSKDEIWQRVRSSK